MGFPSVCEEAGPIMHQHSKYQAAACLCDRSAVWNSIALTGWDGEAILSNFSDRTRVLQFSML